MIRFSLWRSWFVGLLVCLLAAGLFSNVAAQEKIKIEKLDELPRHTYEMTGTVSELLQSDEAFNELAAKVKTNLQSTLDTYEIGDKTTLQQIQAILQVLAFLEEDFDTVLSYIEKRRALEEKEATKLTMGLIATSFIQARGETGKAVHDPEFCSRFQEILAEKVDALPWEIVQEDLQAMKGQMEIINENLLIGMAAAQMDPAVEKSGYMSSDQADQVIGLVSALKIALPLKAEIVAVLGDAVAANKVEKENIWPDRTVTLTGTEGYADVIVGIWDTGVDTDLFVKQLHTNTKEQADGQDTDGNGFVDDLYGIAYDKDQNKIPELLYPLGDAQSRRKDLEDQLKGFFDLTAAIESEESTNLKKILGELQQEDIQAWMEDLTLYTLHSHGTHVAGIALEGNPYAKLTAARLGTDYRLIPDPPTIEIAHKAARAVQETVDYFKARGTRVVNMSWVMSVKGFEGDLEKNGIGKDAEERAQMAREMFAIVKDGLRKAFESAPEILFIGGAGNSDNDVDFDDFVPPAFDLPNLLIAGAVDEAGQATDFTSFGRSVEIYSNGFEVDSVVPGGRMMKLSGTSMASPNVVNLAAKLLAIDPTLTPPEVIELIETGAEDRGETSPMLVIHPKRSVETLMKRLKTEG